LGSEDFESPHLDEFPFGNPSCLLRCRPTIIKDLVNMHIDDAHDDRMVAEETALQVHICAHVRAAQAVATTIETETQRSRSKVCRRPN